MLMSLLRSSSICLSPLSKLLYISPKGYHTIPYHSISRTFGEVIVKKLAFLIAIANSSIAIERQRILLLLYNKYYSSIFVRYD